MSLSIPPPPPPGVAVVARYQEDTDWSGCPWPVRIVQKDRDLPNSGREASSYAWFCATQPIDPDQTYAFLQGRPFDHGFSWNQLRQVDQFEPLGIYRLTCDQDGAPHHPDLQLARVWKELGLEEPMPSELSFNAGAQFLVPGHALLRRDPAWWSWLQRTVSESAWFHAWAMERLWPSLLAS